MTTIREILSPDGTLIARRVVREVTPAARYICETGQPIPARRARRQMHEAVPAAPPAVADETEPIYSLRVDGEIVARNLTLPQARAMAYNVARMERTVASAETAFNLGVPLDVAARYLTEEQP